MRQFKQLTELKKWEGLRLEAYLPTPEDVWTIGYGHTRGVKPGMKITEKQAEAWLKEEVKIYQAAVERRVKVPLTQNQYDALVLWTYNLGEENLRTSTLLRKLNAGDYSGAANEMPRWNKQKGKTLRGLTRRRAAERALFLTKDAPTAFTEAPVKPVTPVNPFAELIKFLATLFKGK